MTRWLTADEVVALLPISRTTFDREVREDSSFPAAKLIGRREFWRKADVEGWLAR